MIMASVMSDFTGEEVITQCLTMGPYLLGLGIGSAWGDKISESNQLKFIWNFEWLSVLLLPLIPLIQLLGIFLFINLSPLTVSLDGKTALEFLLGMTSILALLAGILGGAQLPLILKNSEGLSEEAILAINYLGPLFAGLVIVSMNSQALSLAFQVFIIGLVQIFGLVFLLMKFPNHLKSLLMLFVPLLLIIGVGHLHPTLELLTIKSAYMGTKTSLKELWNPKPLLNVLKGYGSIERVRTAYQTIDLFIEPPQLAYSVPGNASVYLNRKPQFDLLSSDIYHETMVYGGINLLKKNPQSVLILGAGDGLLLKEFKRIPDVQNITMVELDEKMIEWSRTNNVVSHLNQGSLNPVASNVDLIIGDAVSYLRNFGDKKTFDLVLVDLPFPQGHDLAKLYSMEFYYLLRKTLSKEGIVVVDIPLYLNPDNKLSQESLVILKTMKTAGFTQPFLFGPKASFIALNAYNEKLNFNYKSFPENIKLGTRFNFLSPFHEDLITEEEWNDIDINTMFWPKGL